MGKSDGFSLIELLIVVAMILIIAAIAIPNLLRAQLTLSQAIVSPPATAHLEVTHLAVKHRQRRRRMFDEKPEPILALPELLFLKLA